MISKRGQSEIITTVLIILLVLAAIIIVWQVVQGTLNQGKIDITNKRECLGLDMVIVKAAAARGTCSYSEPAGGDVDECSTAAAGAPIVLPASVINLVIGTTCPIPVVRVGGSCVATWAQSTPGSILIRREGTSAVKGVKTQLLIDDKINASSTEALDIIYATDTYSIDNLAVDAQVQVTPLLSDGTPCGLTEKYKVTPI